MSAAETAPVAPELATVYHLPRRGLRRDVVELDLPADETLLATLSIRRRASDRRVVAQIHQARDTGGVEQASEQLLVQLLRDMANALERGQV